MRPTAGLQRFALLDIIIYCVGFLRCLVPTIPGDAKASMRGTGNKLAPRFFVSIRFVQVAHEQKSTSIMKISLKIDGVLDADCTPEFNGKVLNVYTSKGNPDQSLEVIIDEIPSVESVPSQVFVCFDKHTTSASVLKTIIYKN